MSFTLHLKKITDKAGANADSIAKAIILQVFSSVVEKSPVDLGSFRGNWQIGVGAVNGNTQSPDDKKALKSPPSADNLLKAELSLSGYSSKKITYVSNSLPYAHRLEYDSWSDQAPNGMVRLTVLEFRRMIRKATR